MSARLFLAGALGLSEADVPTDAQLGYPEPWDSIGHMRIILALEEQLGRELDSEEIAALHCLTDLEAIMRL